jgi:WD40 repeat protein
LVSMTMRTAPSSEPVRSELVHLQADKGLTLASFFRRIQTVDFKARATREGKEILPVGTSSEGYVSRDGAEIALLLNPPRSRPFLGIVRPDGSALRKFPGVDTPTQMCWSYDKTKLAIAAFRTDKAGALSDYALQVLTLASGHTDPIDNRGFATSQCWSPDGNQIVYSRDGTVRVFDLGTGEIRVLAKGSDPTWSSDGNWIAFRDGDTYYALRPSGDDRKILFSKQHLLSALWWSPDDRIVAYISRNGPFEGPFVLDSEMARLRVRRLSDGSEDWVADFSEIYLPNFQWIIQCSADTR